MEWHARKHAGEHTLQLAAETGLDAQSRRHWPRDALSHPSLTAAQKPYALPPSDHMSQRLMFHRIVFLKNSSKSQTKHEIFHNPKNAVVKKIKQGEKKKFFFS